MRPNDKPTGKAAGWYPLESTRLFENEQMKLRQDHVEVAGKTETEFAYLERSAGALIVPVTRAGQMVLIRQYRYAVDDWCLEIPAGGTHDAGEMPLEEVARKELREEAGATCSRLDYMGHFYSAMSYSNEVCHVYLAHDVELSQDPHTESTESIELLQVPVEDALRLARTGKITAGPCALAVLLCEGELASK